MEIKVIGIYPSKEMSDKGTAHVQLPELELEMKNVNYVKKENSVKVYLPSQYYKNEKGIRIYVPSINFIDKSKQNDLKKSLKNAIQKKLIE